MSIRNRFNEERRRIESSPLSDGAHQAIRQMSCFLTEYFRRLDEMPLTDQELIQLNDLTEKGADKQYILTGEHSPDAVLTSPNPPRDFTLNDRLQEYLAKGEIDRKIAAEISEITVDGQRIIIIL